MGKAKDRTYVGLREEMAEAAQGTLDEGHDRASNPQRGRVRGRYGRVFGLDARDWVSRVARRWKRHGVSTQSALRVRRLTRVEPLRAPIHRHRRNRGGAPCSMRSVHRADEGRRACPRPRPLARLVPRRSPRRARARCELRRARLWARAPSHQAQASSRSSIVFGMSAVKFCGPSFVTRMSSSMRTPMPRHFASTFSAFSGM